jgi:glycosyltransferase involved in cell wall biosynthesis
MDSKDLACKIEKVISNKSNIETMGRNAYQNIKENYSFDNYHEALGKVMEKEFGIVF